MKEKNCDIVGSLIRWKCDECGTGCQSRVEPDGSHALLADCPACLGRLRSGDAEESSPVWLLCNNKRCPVNCNKN